MSDLSLTRELASLFLPERTVTNTDVIQGVIATVDFNNTVSVYLTGTSEFPVGNVRYLDSYTPRVGDVVWLVKKGPDVFVLGKLRKKLSAIMSPYAVNAAGGAEPAFTTGWANFGTDYAHTEFWKDPEGWVHLDGLVAKSGGAAGTIFTLPVGYRPKQAGARFMQLCNNIVLAAVDIHQNGEVYLQCMGASGDTAYVTLSGIEFEAEYSPYEWDDWTALTTYSPAAFNAAYADPPPAVHLRDDGLARLRGFVLTTGVSGLMLDVPPAARTRWGYTFLSSAFTTAGGTVPTDLRVDMQRAGIYLVLGSAYSAGLEGLRWFNDQHENDWVLPSLSNSWVNFDNTFAPASYYKDKFDVVHVRGLIKNGSAGTILTLPVGCRPEKQTVFIAETNGTHGRVDVHVDGTVVFVSGYNGYFDLSHIHFRAQQ